MLIKELPAIVLNKTKILTVTMLLIRCSLIKIQGLSRTKMNEREFQGLSRPRKTTFKIQDANEPCHTEKKLGSVKRI